MTCHFSGCAFPVKGSLRIPLSIRKVAPYDGRLGALRGMMASCERVSWCAVPVSLPCPRAWPWVHYRSDRPRLWALRGVSMSPIPQPCRYAVPGFRYLPASRLSVPVPGLAHGWPPCFTVAQRVPPCHCFPQHSGLRRAPGFVHLDPGQRPAAYPSGSAPRLWDSGVRSARPGVAQVRRSCGVVPGDAAF